MELLIQEILLSLLGYTGDLIIESKNGFVMKPGLRVPGSSEQDQINGIVQLGWYYKELDDLVKKRGFNFNTILLKQSKRENSSYSMGVYNGISDLCSEYMSDVCHLEQIAVGDEYISISTISQHLQKYSVIFPEIYGICLEIGENNISGCLLLDYFANLKHGNPVVIDVISRISMHLRNIFLKQCISWMLLGELDDENKEFFIQSNQKMSRNLSLHRNFNKKTKNFQFLEEFSSLGQSFDWNKTFSLKLDMIPVAFVNSRIAHKILFCGKAVKLLNASQGSWTSSDKKNSLFDSLESLENQGFQYLLKKFGFREKIVCNEENDCFAELKGTSADSTGLQGPSFESLSNSFGPFLHHFQRSGYHWSDLRGLLEKCEQALLSNDLSVTHFEKLVNDLYSSVSLQLWNLLRDKFHFLNLLQTFRNLFLMGKGEFFQCVLDEMIQLGTSNVGNRSSASISITAMSEKLQKHVLRSACKLLNLDEDLIDQMITIHAHSSQWIMDGSNLATKADKSKEFCLFGKCTIQEFSFAFPLSGNNIGNESSNTSNLEKSGVASSSRFSISGGYESGYRGWGVVLFPVTNHTVGFNDSSSSLSSGSLQSHNQLSKDTRRFQRHQQSVIDRMKDSFLKTHGFLSHNQYDVVHANSSSSGGDSEVKQNIHDDNNRIRGGFSLIESKYLWKGFSLSSELDIQWNGIREHMFYALSNPYDDGGSSREMKDGIVSLASLQFLLHGASLSAMDWPEDDMDFIETQFMGAPHFSVEIALYGRNLLAEDKTSRSIFAKLMIYSSLSGSSAVPTGSRFSNDDPSGGAQTTRKILAEKILLVETPGWLFGRDRSYGIKQSSTSRRLSTDEPWHLDIQYARETTNSSSSLKSRTSSYVLRARVIPSSQATSLTYNDSTVSSETQISWDLSIPLDLTPLVRLHSGDGRISVLGSTFLGFPSLSIQQEAQQPLVSIRMIRWDMTTSSLLYSYPVASAFTSARYVDTFLHIQAEVSRLQTLLSIQLRLTSLPSIFGILLDASIWHPYSRCFTWLMKLKYLQAHLLTLWKSKSSLTSDRIFCHLRHSLHSFLSNLLYYLQVDVIDVEFHRMMAQFDTVQDFPSILRLHRLFLANLSTQFFLDHQLLMETIERILHLIIRFIAVCRLIVRSEHPQEMTMATSTSLSQDHYSASNSGDPIIPSSSDLAAQHWESMPIYVPPEEMESIRREFVNSISYLYQLMKKTENKGLLFRLDFNGYLSQLVAENLPSQGS